MDLASFQFDAISDASFHLCFHFYKYDFLSIYLQTVPGELYGPVMILFTLVAVLLFSMKVSEHTVVDFFPCF